MFFINDIFTSAPESFKNPLQEETHHVQYDMISGGSVGALFDGKYSQ